MAAIISNPQDPGGEQSRNAAEALSLIEAHVRYICKRIREVLAEFESHEAPTDDDQPLRLSDLGRFAPQWRLLVPDDPRTRAILIRLLIQKYGLSRSFSAPLRGACGLDSADVREAYRRLYESEIEDACPDSEAGPEESTGVDAGWLSLNRGDVLCRQGEPAEHLYYLTSGRLGVFVGQDQHQVGEVSRGEYVGEMAMLTGEPRSASVYALRDSELLVLDKASFDAIQTPETLRRLTGQVITRLRRTIQGQDQSRRVSTVAIVPSSSNVPLDAFCRGLQECLERQGSVVSLSSKQLNGIPAVDPSGAAVAEWLNRQELEHAFVLYRAEVDATDWSQRCLRQADLVLVAAAPGDMQPGAAAQLLVLDDPSATPCEVVLLGTDTGYAARRWARWKRVGRVYHVDPENGQDVERLARCIVGSGVGLVLGGGAARGYAHIGVLRALAEAGIPVDAVGGTSAGALVAAGHALGWTPEEMLDRLRIPDRIKWDFSPPIVSVTRGVYLRRWLESWLGDRDIEDLRIPYFCVSSNLTRAEPKVHTSGPLLKAVMASNSGPALLPPVVEDGDLLVDGALLANVPTDDMRAQPQIGPILAVDVSPPVDLASNDDYGLGLSGWRLLRDRFIPGRKRVRLPSLFAVQLRSQLLASLAQRKQVAYGPNDLLLRLSLEDYSYLDYGNIRAIADAAYEQAAPLVTEWKKRIPPGIVG